MKSPASLCIAVALLLTSCEKLARPSEEEVRQLVLAEVARMERYPWSPKLEVITGVKFGETMTSQGNMVEMALGIPKDTKIFPVRVSFDNKGYLDFWVFTDSFGKKKAVRPPS